MPEAAQYWSGVLAINQHQKQRLSNYVASQFDQPQNTTISILGFSYKKNTSDTRSTPVAFLAYDLIKKGFNVRITDPQVEESHFQFEMEIQGLDLTGNTNYTWCGPDLNRAIADS
jgi:UDPglucose 6-dehydrogenase